MMLTSLALVGAILFAGTGDFARMAITRDEAGQYVVREGGEPVLRYNYATIEPGEVLEKVAAADKIYARARSNYIHPLWGLSGEELTRDWAVDHPHHRGIYWAWPEVDYGAERGDLHALQRVFARPTGAVRARTGANWAEIEAQNNWMWEDATPIVRETVRIRAYAGTEAGRLVDIQVRMTALQDGVSLARRGTNLYGGLNMRMNTVADQRIAFHTDPPEAKQRAAWATMHGVFGGASRPATVAVFQHPANPDYPGDWVQYPELNWFQPTFPAPNTRYALPKGKTLTLRYRLWISSGPAPEESALRAAWERFAAEAR